MKKIDFTKRWVKITAIVLGTVAVFTGGFLLWVLKTYPHIIYNAPLDCAWYKYAGLHCAGCGVTRALHNLLNGNLYAAFRMNPFVISSVPLWVALGVWELKRALCRQPHVTLPMWVIWTYVGIMLAFVVMRNLPWAPFCYLAPTPV